MNEDIISIIVAVLLIISAAVVIWRRKKAGISGIKSALSYICLFLMALINLLAYWFDFRGIISWGLAIVFLTAGAYFMKYIPEAGSKQPKP